MQYIYSALYFVLLSFDLCLKFVEGLLSNLDMRMLKCLHPSAETGVCF